MTTQPLADPYATARDEGHAIGLTIVETVKLIHDVRERRDSIALDKLVVLLNSYERCGKTGILDGVKIPSTRTGIRPTS